MSDVMEQAALVALLRLKPDGLTWAEIAAEVLEKNSAEAVWEIRRPLTLEDHLAAAVEDISQWQRDGTQFMTILDDRYPRRLRGIHQAPPVLFARGELRALDPAVAVVGSRAASSRGIKIAQDTSEFLCARGITVIAGLAVGIDAAAHNAALAANGRTVAVIASGINRSYPAANRDLQSDISKCGLLISQFWPDAPPQKHQFIMRNATMSGYGLATVVVEAGEHSGARSQARMAVEHGRPVILTAGVLRENRWAALLEGRPGVHIARSQSELEDQLQGLTSGPDSDSSLRARKLLESA